METPTFWRICQDSADIHRFTRDVAQACPWEQATIHVVGDFGQFGLLKITVDVPKARGAP